MRLVCGNGSLPVNQVRRCRSHAGPAPQRRTRRKDLIVRSNVTKSVVGLIAMLALGALSVTPAFASGPPIVETKAATKVAEKEATLNGVVNPNGAATKYYFEYGRSKEVFKTSEVSAGSGTSNVEVSATPTGLKAETLYEFRLIATNSNATTDGKWLEFWTTAGEGLPEFKKTVSNKKLTLTGSVVGFKTVTGLSYSCGGSSGEGEITGVKTATIALKFAGCGVDGVKCTSEGDESGVITTGSLPAQLVYLSKEKHEVALVVNYHETNFASWVCLGSNQGIHGSIIVPLSPVNTPSKSFTMDFAGKEGVQQPSSFEGAEGGKVAASPTMALVSEIYYQASLEDSMTLATKLQAEIQA
jgi:hypothetical protein